MHRSRRASVLYAARRALDDVLVSYGLKEIAMQTSGTFPALNTPRMTSAKPKPKPKPKKK